MASQNPTSSKRKKDNFDGDTQKKKKNVNISQSSTQYFVFKEERIIDGMPKQFFTCEVCKKELNGTVLGNLSSHLRSHKDIFAKISEPKISIEQKRIKLLMDCVEMVTINARSFSHLYDSALHSMLKEKLDELESSGRKLNLKDPHLTEVKNCLLKVSEKISERIKDEIKNRPLSLILDIVSKRGRSILGFSLQYIVDGRLRIRSIGMIKLEASHTGAYLAELIVKRLEEFGVKLYQILTITTDNGSNMIKMIKDFRTKFAKMQENASNCENVAHHEASVQETSNASNIELTELNEETADAEIEKLIVEKELTNAFDILFGEIDDVENKENEDVLESLPEHMNLLNDIAEYIESMRGVDFMWKTTGIRCSAHTLQLAIKDALKKLPVTHSNVIGLCRHVAKHLRLKSTIHELNHAQVNYHLPRLDVETRWCSTYLMLSDIIRCKDVIDHLAGKNINICRCLNNKWEILKELCHILEIPYYATLRLQNVILTLSEVYGIWLEMRLRLERLSEKPSKTSLSKHLLNAIKNRQSDVFNNSAMICAIYLDPRFRGEITVHGSFSFTTENDAKEYLKALWRRLNMIKKSIEEVDNSIAVNNGRIAHETQTCTTLEDTNFDSFDARREINQYLNRGIENTNLGMTEIEDADIVIDNFNPDWIPFERSILDYWEGIKENNRILYELAMAIYAIPPTEVQIERDFSALDKILTKFRCSLTQNMLEAILNIHLNSELFYSVRDDEIMNV